MPPTPSSKSSQATSHVVRNGRRLAGQAARGQAPAPFLHADPANRDARENTPPAEPPLLPPSESPPSP